MAVLGKELSSRAYPAGPPIRDAAQRALLARLRARLAIGLRWRTEVPVRDRPSVGPLDHRAWDAAVDGPDWSLRVEAETRVRDVQALERKLTLKQRDGGVDVVILLLNDTRHHRDLLTSDGAGLRERFPISARNALRALGRGEDPGGNSLVLL